MLLYRRTFDQLAAVGRDGSALALAALYLAQQIDMLAPSPGALPGQLIAQFAAALARAMGNAAGAASGGSPGLADIIGGSGGLVALRGGRS